jgi:hypothetical protein
MDRRGLLLGFLAGMLVLVMAGTAAAQNAFPDVDIVLVADFADGEAWLALHREILGTPVDSPLGLRISLPAGTGGSRSLTVEQPKFAVVISMWNSKWPVRVTITGKVPAAEALSGITPFQHAAFQVQAGAVENELTLTYSLAEVVGQLLELHLGR